MKLVPNALVKSRDHAACLSTTSFLLHVHMLLSLTYQRVEIQVQSRQAGHFPTFWTSLKSLSQVHACKSLGMQTYLPLGPLGRRAGFVTAPQRKQHRVVWYSLSHTTVTRRCPHPAEPL